MIKNYVEEKLFPRFPGNWPRYLDIGSGWYELVSDLNDSLAVIDPNYRLFQVKEKFGTLRFYAEVSQEMYDSTSDNDEDQARLREIIQKFNKIIGDYEHASSFICEKCSRYGRLTGEFWLKTLCTKCESEEDITDE